MPASMFRRARFLPLLLMLLCSVIAATANAQVERFLAGVHYTELPASPEFRDLQSTDSRPRITEIFWYGCPHCYELDPLLENWVSTQGDSIMFARVPAIWNAITRHHARLFYAEQALGMHDELHTLIFDSIHKDRKPLADRKSVKALFAAHGVEEERFGPAFDSFSMDSTLRKTEAMVLALRLPGVPAFVVDGKFVVSGNSNIASYATMLEVVEFLMHK